MTKQMPHVEISSRYFNACAACGGVTPVVPPHSLRFFSKLQGCLCFLFFSSSGWRGKIKAGAGDIVAMKS